MEVNFEELYDEGSASELFQQLDDERSTILERARDCSKLTIPSILPDDGHTEDSELDTPYQALGARLVNNLSSKLLLSLLPPNTPFFRLLINDDIKEQLSQQVGTKSNEQGSALNEAEEQLSLIEQEILKQIEREAIRVPTFEAIKALVVTGNALCYKSEKTLVVYKLDGYVIQRDFEGQPVQIITKNVALKHTLPEEVLTQLQSNGDVNEDDDIMVYTRCVYRNGTWYEYQQVEDMVIEGSQVTYSNNSKFPYIPLRWSSINGENYGRGLVEQYLGDFRTLEGIYQLLIENASVSGRTIFGKVPGSQVEISELNDAENGACIYGDLERDITVLRVEKGADLQIPMQLVQDLTRRLEQAFLVASSVARDSDRTTATEIRYMAADLEEALGGVYSVLALEYQRPLAYILLEQIDLADLGTDIEPVVVTGIEALGRNNEVDKLRQFNAFLMELGSPEMVLSRLNIDTYISKIGSALGLEVSTLVKSSNQVAQEQQAAQEQQLMQQGASNMVQQATTQQ